VPGHEGLHPLEPFLLLVRQIEVHGMLLACSRIVGRTVCPPPIRRKAIYRRLAAMMTKA
jgi:hypothetical protein